ncbi:MAG: hypothetical protein HY922_00320 [Elusimicrobia bacterium]|nr:hypothetical protein [Elusimicrobiota bacterium]
MKRFRDVVAETSADGLSQSAELEEAVEPIKVVAPKSRQAFKLAEVEEKKDVPAAAKEPLEPTPSGSSGRSPLPERAAASPAPLATGPAEALSFGSPAQTAKPDVKTTTLGLSPAVVYLQNLKAQMEHFEKEIHQLHGDVVGMAQRHDNQFDALLKRLGELQNELHHQVQAHQQAASAPQRAPQTAPPRAQQAAAKEPPMALKSASPAPAQQKPAHGPEPVRIAVPGKVPAAQAAPPAAKEPPSSEGGRSPLPERAAAEKPKEAAPAPLAVEFEPTSKPAPKGGAPAAEETLILGPEDVQSKSRGPVWPV